MQRVSVASSTRQQLMPCNTSKGKDATAWVVRQRSSGAIPSRLSSRPAQMEIPQPIELKADPGSKVTGVALVADLRQSAARRVSGLWIFSNRGQSY